MIDNTELLAIFREHLADGTQLEPTIPLVDGMIPFETGITQVLKTSYKCPVGEDEIEMRDKCAPAGMQRLAEMVGSFGGAKQFHQLGDPLRGCKYQIIVDPEIEIRELTVFLEEEWTSPNENDDGSFVPRQIHPDCHKTTFEIVFRFGLPLEDLPEQPETD